ncbi:MAG TPA: hypothetical protein VE131_07210, partial [Terriglobales bacterium]|nr:hypothetical protein [Terriglobales bacterium]
PRGLGWMSGCQSATGRTRHGEPDSAKGLPAHNTLYDKARGPARRFSPADLIVRESQGRLAAYRPTQPSWLTSD